MGRSSLVLRLGVVLASTLLALLGAELLLRRLGYVPNLLARHHRIFARPDPLLGWIKRPGAVGIHQTTEYRVEERLNERGLRGELVPHERRADAFRVLVLGDSFAEGYTVELADLFSERLRGRLEAGLGRRVEMINAGVGGWSTDQELLFYEGEGCRYRADLVVLVFHDNDAWDNLADSYWRGRKPRFVLAEDGLVLRGVPVPPPRTRTAGSAGSAWLAARSHLYALLVERLPFRRRPGAAGRAPQSCAFYRRDPPAEVTAAWELFRALLARLRRQVEDDGGRLLVFHAPADETLGDADAWARFMEPCGLPAADLDPEAVAARLDDACRVEGVALVDQSALAAAARRGRERREPLYFPLDGHWTPAGHAAVAAILADAILADAALSR